MAQPERTLIAETASVVTFDDDAKYSDSVEHQNSVNGMLLNRVPECIYLLSFRIRHKVVVLLHFLVSLSGNIMLNEIDLSVFDNDVDDDLQCDGSPVGKCGAMRRVNTLLRYHHRLMGSGLTNPRKLFVNFCDRHYDERLATNDYIHCIQTHFDNDSRRQILKEMDMECTNIGECAGSLRHYRRTDAATDGLCYHPILEQFDSLHFNVFHVEEAGFRVYDDEKDDDKKDDDEVDVETAAEIVIERARAMKKQQFEVERWNGGATGKFNISVQVQSAKGIVMSFKLIYSSLHIGESVVIVN